LIIYCIIEKLMNIFKLTRALIAVCVISSCSDFDKLGGDSLEGAGIITVSSQVGAQVKAGYAEDVLPGEFIMDIDQGNESYNYSKLTMTKSDVDNKYRADIGELSWASEDHSNVRIKAITVPAGSTLDRNGSLKITISSNQKTDENFLQNDVLGASTGNGVTVNGDHITVCFNHLMSKMHVIYEADEDVEVTSIKLRNVSMGGTYSYETMSSVSSDSPSNGTIDMYLNAGAQYGINTAEAIFHPYTSTSSNKPSIVVTANVNGTPKTFDPVYFASNGITFQGGKRYRIKLNVSTEQVTIASLSADNAWTKNVPGGKILWIGTSIPAGGGTAYSYPQMIANSTGLEVINNSVPGSSVTMMADASWIDDGGWFVLGGGKLSQTHEEVEVIYREKLESLGNGKEWVEEQMEAAKALSYESLIIPYIDGTIDNCRTVIIDHGFNDINAMIGESALYNWGNEPFRNHNHLLTVIYGQETYEQYASYITQDDFNDIIFPKGCYLYAMGQVIKAIQDLNLDVKIIIGNYFASISLYLYLTFADMHAATGLYPDWEHLTGHITYSNEAIATMFGLDIVNVYKYETEYLSHSDYYNTFLAFCPDMVHPSTDETGKSNRAIADIYLREFARIFSGTNTQQSLDCGWSDVECF
jgi:hypothetical protein